MKKAGRLAAAVFAAMLLVTGCGAPAEKKAVETTPEQSSKIEQKEEAKNLKDAFKKDFKVGVAINPYQLKDEETKKIILENFNSITMENGMKPEAILDQRASENSKDGMPAINEENLEECLSLAKDNGLVLRGHCLVWHNQTPEWFFCEKYDAGNAKVNKETMKKRMESYIKKVLSFCQEKYPGVVYALDVVNESCDDGGGYRTSSLWYEIYGDESYIEDAFTFARKYADKDVKLFYNDYNEYMPSKVSTIAELVKKLYDKKLIDGVGFQSHWDMNYPDTGMISDAMQKYSEIGDLEIQFTEVDMHNTDDSEEGLKKLADRYKEFFEMILKERFSIDAKVGFDFSKTIDRSLKMESDYRLQQEIHTIVEHADIVEKEQKEEKKARKKAAATKKEHMFKKKPKYSDDPTLLYGRNCDGELMEIKDIYDEIGEVVIHGQITFLETREIRNEKTIIIFHITDFTDTISCKVFVRNEQLPDILDGLKKGGFYRIKAVAMYDKFDHEISLGSVAGIKAITDFREKRQDTSMEKRVELHLHTVMSDNDSVVQIKDIVNRAYEWGHPAVAITDHGVLQGFPIARHAYEDLRLKEDDPFKIIYGVEGYFVDDLGDLIIDSKGQSLMDSYVVFDIETTGFHPSKNKIIEIGAVKVINGEITDRFSEFINPRVPIPFTIERLTGINDAMVCDAPGVEEILPKFLSFCEGCVLVAHNASFDTSFIRYNAEQLGIEFPPTYVDTVGLARFLLPHLGRFKLDTVAKELHVSLENHHRAVDDAGATAEIFVKFIEMLKDRGIYDLAKLNQFGENNADAVRKLPSYHVIILALNEVGRVNLYTLISMSHLKYYARRPRIPKSELSKYREGLLVGSACEAGELYQAILNDKSEERIAKIANFYDYLEIQPVGNNRFMIADDKHDMISSEEDLKEINRKIVKLGEQFKKPVVATCDVHFMDPQDEIYRRIIMAGNGFSDADEQAPLYLRTTEEMLEEFAYLGSEKAEEVVITNTNKIADMIEKISPIHPDKFPPVIENSDQDLKNICFTKAHEMYGDPLPEIVESRLDRELNSIISNGYAVMYIIAQKLVWKSNEDGYLVGSRGSVGSSLAATMSGITEVNPLPPHYLCPNPDCKYSDFDSPEVKQYAGMAGCDMPDKICPKCGTRMKKEGFDIPFETFLGFKGDKEPDIDLNFSGEYQANAHRYTEVIFGKGQTFKAGTIGTLAEKTAFGYVKNYFEERGVHKRYCEINRIVQGCTGVRRTTGQHPGGIIVLPVGEEIEKFTPVQHPANDVNSDIITTHFDYHSIDGNLLKLDILGHDDPTMIRMLEDLTGISARDVPLDQRDVMSLFASTKALKIEPEDIGGNPGTGNQPGGYWRL